MTPPPPRIVGIGAEVFVDGLTPARIGFTETQIHKKKS